MLPVALNRNETTAYFTLLFYAATDLGGDKWPRPIVVVVVVVIIVVVDVVVVVVVVVPHSLPQVVDLKVTLRKYDDKNLAGGGLF